MTRKRDGLAELDEIARVFSALAHASRRQILLVLHVRGDRVTAGEIAKRFSCSWPTTTRHLRVLQAAGLISVHRRGRERFYQLEKTKLGDVVSGWLGHFELPI